jgi:hypothetical protein
MWNLVSVHLETVLVLVQDRSTVCAKRAVGLKIVLDAPNDTPRWRVSHPKFFYFGMWVENTN